MKHNLKVPEHIKKHNFKPFMWGGSIEIPMEYLFNYKKLTPEIILGEKNAEIRRVLLQFYGVERFLTNGGGEKVMGPVDENDIQDAELWKLEIGNNTLYFLKYIDGTPHEYFAGKEGFTKDGRKIYVAGYPDITQEDMKKYLGSMADVVGFTYGKAPGQYNPSRRT